MLQELIMSCMESLEPQTSILRFLEGQEGKRLDKRLLEKMQVQWPDLRIQQSAGMTMLEWGGYSESGGGKGGRLLIAHALKDVRVDSNFIHQRNLAYFEAAEARNEKRQQALADPELLSDLEKTIQSFLTARDKLAKMMNYGTVFAPDRHAIEEKFGLKTT
jgi:hypothetical protein